MWVMGLSRFVWVQPVNKELGPNFLCVADRYPTEVPRSEPKGLFISFIINCGLKWMKAKTPERWRQDDEGEERPEIPPELEEVFF